jgi:hypothetical protein
VPEEHDSSERNRKMAPMKPYGYFEFSLKKPRCYCWDCLLDYEIERRQKRTHRKRARRLGKIEIKKQLSE